MQIAERLDGRVDQALCTFPRRDVVAIGDRLASHRLDLIDHLLGGAGVTTLAVDRRTDVIHHHMGAMSSQTQRMFPADSATGTGHHHYTSFT